MADSNELDVNEELPTGAELEGGEGTESKPKLQLEVKIDKRSACERHITVAVAQDDVARYFDKEYGQMMPEAKVPGFRPGHAPRRLVEHRFRKEVAERVKGSLLMDSLAQIHDDEKLSAISEPDLDLESVEVPESGPLTFEFDLEVRPEFDLPKWKGLTLQKPVREFTAEDIDKALQKIVANRGQLVPFDGPAAVGDYLTTNLTIRYADQVMASANEEVIRIRPVLSFRDGRLEEFDKLMVGVRAGETRQGEVRITEDSPNELLRGQTVVAVFEVLEVKKLELPELTEALLEDLGGFQLEADLRDAIKDTLERRLEYQQRQRAREQITTALMAGADWDLPPGLLRRQSMRELQRAVMELQSSGFSDEEIQAHENLLRQNSSVATARALKEHFILERIAEDEKIEADENDYEAEIRLIAAQADESPRRVRARLEKSGSMDVLRNQIIERKVVNLILEHAEFKEVPYQAEEEDISALDLAAGGSDESDIPEAKPGGAPAAERPHEPRTHE